MVYIIKLDEWFLPPAIRLTVSKTWSDRIWRMATLRSNCMGVSDALLLTHLTKCGLACTKVLNKLSSRVWKSWVKVEIGSSPFSLQSREREWAPRFIPHTCTRIPGVAIFFSFREIDIHKRLLSTKLFRLVGKSNFWVTRFSRLSRMRYITKSRLILYFWLYFEKYIFWNFEVVHVYSQVSVGCRRYAKTNTSGYRVAGIKSFELASKEMSGKAEIARVFVEDRHQVIRHDVLIRVWKASYNNTYKRIHAAQLTFAYNTHHNQSDYTYYYSTYEYNYMLTQEVGCVVSHPTGKVLNTKGATVERSGLE